MISLKAKDYRYSSRGSGKILKILTKILLCRAKMFGGRLGVIHAFLAPNIILSVAAAVVFFFFISFSRISAPLFFPFSRKRFFFCFKSKG